MHLQDQRWATFVSRFRSREWRTPIFYDMVMTDLGSSERIGNATVVDVGCGKGFDCDPTYQRRLGQAAAMFIGIEPDINIQLDPSFHVTHRGTLETATIDENSVDICYSVMVLEHVLDPQMFWRKVYAVLRPGGVCWGFTVDSSHWFARFSTLAERMRIKGTYLNWLLGTGTRERYENYPTHYGSNTPEQIEVLTSMFERVDVIFMKCPGQTRSYFPERLRWISDLMDRMFSGDTRRGANLAIRVQK